MNTTRRYAMFAAAALLSAGIAATPALAQSRKDPGAPGPVDGTITMTAQGAAAGIGYTWGDGTLRFGGHSYPFTVQGVTIADVGYSKVVGHGRVYKLHRLQDFSGTYVASTGEATAGKGIGGEILENSNGVQIRINDVTRGARLQGSADGIKLTLK
jgi:hypothetical protein